MKQMWAVCLSNNFSQNDMKIKTKSTENNQELDLNTSEVKKYFYLTF